MPRWRRLTEKEYKEIKNTLELYLKETTMPYSLMEPWKVINRYFEIDDDEDSPIIYLKLSNSRCSLWQHSTLDINDAKNFITYMRILCKNLLIWPR